jgi:tetratricopeptide (TPR) repeat protein
LIEDLPFAAALRHEINQETQLAERVGAVQELHLLTDRIRFLSSVEAAPVPELARLEEHCRAFWQQHVLIATTLLPQLEPAPQQQAHTDVADLLILWTRLRVGLAPAHEKDARRREALFVLEQAEAGNGPSRILCLERHEHAAALGMANEAAEAAQEASVLPPRSAWEHYALGRFYLQEGQLGKAESELEEAVHLQPESFWAHFYRANCAYRLGRFEDALTGFTACVVLAPQADWCYYNRGLAYAARGRTERALRDYDMALHLNPQFALAALNRGLLHYREGHYKEALRDLHAALKNGANPATVHYDLALVYLAQNDHERALVEVRQSLRADPGNAEARRLHERIAAHCPRPTRP